MGWILFTFLAAFMQAWRNALQSKLSQFVSVSGVTLARFIVAGPIALVYLFLLYQWQPVAFPNINLTLTFFIIGASIAQIIATVLLVKLFKLNNYAVGAGLAKSEAIVAAVFGSIFFGSQLTVLGWFGIATGSIAVFLLSGFSFRARPNFKTILLGLGSGSGFALTSLWVRAASHNIGLPFPHSAAWVLFIVISLQTILLFLYVSIYQRETLTQLWQYKKITSAVSFCSCIGSIGWFSAMSLQFVPYVKTLGQVEVFFTILISVYWLKQKPKKQDVLGLFLIAAAAILVMYD
ncbi:DMT family transporter [Pseudoalteromonas denitrificans]|uniref:EamA-like transporter family protein n=1 Tax=Pseudoalteromonas denitrificans DSM 6059 TaxID=1123010 RepID=A0A1I1S6P1_9GAMM|nr:DMT family transporter [Pseudoalteromonas denitrificans]SFD39493.1 EamA-like transporter family protein [Pseudoalteromonas denitrificans DSM 6059]